MAEAVATLALASSILQVIDFGTKVASTASKVYQASKRDDGSLTELEEIYKNLSSTLDVIQKDDSAAVNSTAHGMKILAKGCSELAKELVDTLHDLGFGEVKTKRKALWVALKHAWKDANINTLQTRLNEFRSQLTMCLLVSLRQFAGQSLTRQGEILEKLGKMRDGPIGTSVLEYVTSGLDASSQEQQRDFLKRDLIIAIQEQREISSGDTNSRIIEINQKVKQKSIDLFLKSLEYAGMQDREDRIAGPHETTFKWIFEKSSDKWVGFGEWLESDSKLYWITGKPGSGKSTMMRYISHLYPQDGQQFPRCRSHQYLKRWAGSRKLIVASFYFWNSGLELQTTQTGLLFTLLRQIFEQCPDLLPLASPDRWENLCLFGQAGKWSDYELRSILLRCIENLEHVNATIALFVDGLDEFDGDPQVLISMFEEIQKLPQHKLCVASRPWNDFSDAFAQDSSLMIEHLTHHDIKNFITARFESDSRFFQLRLREKAFADQLVEDIVSKSSGVFLWVSLVVSALLLGMGNGDRIVDFQRRLDQLPPDLSDLYRKMIRSLEPFYLEHTAQLFALVAASREPMNLLLASYVDEEDSKVALEMERTPVTDQDVQVRMEAMRRRINSRSKGLLEVRGGTSTPQGFVYDASTHKKVTVQYLHRTVKDFVEKDAEVKQIFDVALKSSYDPHLMLLAGHLAYMKKVPVGMDRRTWREIYRECFSHARGVKTQNIDTMIHILDSLDKSFPLDIVSWTRGHDLRFGWSFLSLATAHNVTEYVRARAMKPCLIQQPDNKPWPLLMDAISFTHSAHGLVEIENSVSSPSVRDSFRATIEVLLDKGADPRFVVDGLTGARGLTSPLVRAAAGYMYTGHDLHLLAVETLATKAKFDASTLACTIYEYMRLRQHSNYSEKRLKVGIWSWYLVKKRLRKALDDTAHGKPPNFKELWNDMIKKHRLGHGRNFRPVFRRKRKPNWNLSAFPQRPVSTGDLETPSVNPTLLRVVQTDPEPASWSRRDSIDNAIKRKTRTHN